MSDKENIALLQAMMIVNNNIVELARLLTTKDELEQLDEAAHTFTEITDVTGGAVAISQMTLRFDGESWEEAVSEEEEE